MECIIQDYFKDLFSFKRILVTERLLRGIEKSVTTKDYEMLTKKYTAKEVTKALKSMRPMKASGDDGFPALFYQYC